MSKLQRRVRGPGLSTSLSAACPHSAELLTLYIVGSNPASQAQITRSGGKPSDVHPKALGRHAGWTEVGCCRRFARIETHRKESRYAWTRVRWKRHRRALQFFHTGLGPTAARAAPDGHRDVRRCSGVVVPPPGLGDPPLVDPRRCPVPTARQLTRTPRIAFEASFAPTTRRSPVPRAFLPCAVAAQ